jgi:hypothetical protein
MPLPAWPDGVPFAPMVDGFQPIQRALPPIVTDMEGANQRQRARPGDNIGTLGQTIIMYAAQFEVFTAWWKGTLSMGTARFNAPVWLGTDFATKVCQFAADGRPSDSFYVPGAVKVSMKLRVYDV